MEKYWTRPKRYYKRDYYKRELASRYVSVEFMKDKVESVAAAMLEDQAVRQASEASSIAYLQRKEEEDKTPEWLYNLGFFFLGIIAIITFDVVFWNVTFDVVFWNLIK